MGRGFVTGTTTSGTFGYEGCDNRTLTTTTGDSSPTSPTSTSNSAASANNAKPTVNELICTHDMALVKDQGIYRCFTFAADLSAKGTNLSEGTLIRGYYASKEDSTIAGMALTGPHQGKYGVWSGHHGAVKRVALYTTVTAQDKTTAKGTLTAYLAVEAGVCSGAGPTAGAVNLTPVDVAPVPPSVARKWRPARSTHVRGAGRGRGGAPRRGRVPRQPRD
ncbi:unnamed protein product [Vitrella brassicaformis CCMP3155]|uniref:Uncharacterized protein n=1 Tax=Vitrella brassicaformis (strain CCMP3155) TaxID=1169540 RepID=A0A0G4G8L1_VITBC|nr:unnamed protein product [Vitrella brassicaformis CCMP3155]|eukprot:CEM25171.1 unnamed protein product [Vitrella brassicaformis CCMP3155]